MKSFSIEVITAVGAASLLAACAINTTPRTDAQMGESMNILKAQQILNPDASRNPNVVNGIDGKSAKGAINQYHESFRKPAGEAPSPITIGVGTGGTGK